MNTSNLNTYDVFMAAGEGEASFDRPARTVPKERDHQEFRVESFSGDE